MVKTNETPLPPELSVILPTDTHETIEPVLKKLRRQTMASRLEVILVTPSASEMEQNVAHESAFASIRVLRIDSLVPMGAPRAMGIRAAAAPMIFVGETHAYLRPDALARLVSAQADGNWSVVVPGFENANPTGALSWAAFLVDYARWSARLPAGEIPEAPLYDCLYRREALLAMGDRLEPMLSFGDDLRRALQAGRQRAFFEPSARIDHANITRPWAWFHEHFLIGIMIGSRRARSWNWGRRLAYLAASPLVPPTLLWRAWPGIRRIVRVEHLPIGTLPALALLFLAKGAGEFVGYAGGGRVGQEEATNRYEIRRLDYVSRPF